VKWFHAAGLSLLPVQFKTLAFSEGGAVGDVQAKLQRLEKEAFCGQAVVKATRAKGRAQGASGSVVSLHCRFKRRCQLTHPNAKLAGECAVGDGLARRCDSGKAGFKICVVQGRLLSAPEVRPVFDEAILVYAGS
jgi:hypothetical protein